MIFGRQRRHKGRIAAAVMVTCLVLSAAGCVGEPEEQPVRFESGQAVELSTDAGLATLRVTLEGSAVVRGENSFTVRVLPGNAASQVELQSVTVFMPAHGHASNAPEIEHGAEDYRVSGVVLFMAGRWEVTLHVVVDGAADVVTLPVDVP